MNATKQHPLDNIAQSGAQPMKKVEALRTGNMDAITGMAWAQQAIALCMGQASPWTKLALDLFTMNTEQREAALKAWRTWKADKTKAFNNGEEQTPKMDEKTFKRIMGTATTRLSHISTICKALDSGMDRTTLESHYKVKSVEELSIDSIYQVAQTFSKAKAGRTPDTFLVKMNKFLEAAGKTVAEGDVDTYNKVVKFVNELQG